MEQEITPAKYIRQTVFGFKTQYGFSNFLGVRQPTVSRWEKGQPFSPKYQRKIRVKAQQLGVMWNDSWFFDVPLPKKHRPGPVPPHDNSISVEQQK